jgi:hypothetical protein
MKNPTDTGKLSPQALFNLIAFEIYHGFHFRLCLYEIAEKTPQEYQILINVFKKIKTSRENLNTKKQ